MPLPDTSYIPLPRPAKGHVRVAFLVMEETGPYQVITTDLTRREWQTMSHSEFIREIADPALVGLRNADNLPSPDPILTKLRRFN